MTNKEYSDYVDTKSPKSNVFVNTLWAFLVGGAICTAGQGLMEIYRACNMDEKTASSGVSITLIFIATFLTALHIYDNIAKYAGAGSLVPITGFANAMVSPAMEFKSEGLVLGLAAKMFIIVGPVLVYGIGASVIYGIILVLFKL